MFGSHLFNARSVIALGLALLMASPVVLPGVQAVGEDCLGGPTDLSPDFTDGCYHEYLLYNADTTQIDVIVVPPQSPYALRDVQLMEESVEYWEHGIDQMSAAMEGMEWVGGIDIDWYVLGRDPIPNEVMWDPEIIVQAAAVNPVLLAGIGLNPYQFAFNGNTACHGFDAPFMFQESYPTLEQIQSDSNFHQHEGSNWGSLRYERGQCDDGNGGDVCIAANTNFLFLPDADNARNMFDLVSHEFGHCIGIGHVGDASDFSADAYPEHDIMSYETDRIDPNRVLCVSSLNVEALGATYAHLLGRGGNGRTSGGYVHMHPDDYTDSLDLPDSYCEEPTAGFADTAPITDADPTGTPQDNEAQGYVGYHSGGGGSPEIAVASPLNGADVAAGSVTFSGNVDRTATGGSGGSNPTASLQADVASGASPLTVTFTLDGDDDGSIASWEFDADGDGTADFTGTGDPAGLTQQYTYSSDALYLAKLTVTDDESNTGEAIQSIQVGSGLPGSEVGTDPQNDYVQGRVCGGAAGDVCVDPSGPQHDIVRVGMSDDADSVQIHITMDDLSSIPEGFYVNSQFTTDAYPLAEFSVTASITTAGTATVVNMFVGIAGLGLANPLHTATPVTASISGDTVTFDIPRATLNGLPDGSIMDAITAASTVPTTQQYATIDDAGVFGPHTVGGSAEAVNWMDSARERFQGLGWLGGPASIEESSDPENDSLVPLTSMDVRRVALVRDGDDSFDIEVEVENLEDLPPSLDLPAGLGGLAFRFKTTFCTAGGDATTAYTAYGAMADDSAECYQVTFTRGALGDVVSFAASAHNGSGCGTTATPAPEAVVDGNIVRFTVYRASLTLTSTAADVGTCTGGITMNGGGVTDGETLVWLAGSSILSAGAGVTANPASDESGGLVSPAYEFGTSGSATPVERVELSVGGTWLGSATVDTSVSDEAVWTANLDLAAYDGESITVLAEWKEADGAIVATDTVALDVGAVGSGDAAVSIDAPADASTVSGTVAVSGQAGHEDGNWPTSGASTQFGFPITPSRGHGGSNAGDAELTWTQPQDAATQVDGDTTFEGTLHAVGSGGGGGAGEARAIVAVIDGLFNVYHDFYYDGSFLYDSAPSSVTAQVLADMAADDQCQGAVKQFQLTRTGNHAADVAADAALWNKLQKGECAWIVGTNLIVTDQTGSSGKAIILPPTDGDTHGTGTTAAVLRANPDAVVVAIYDSYSGAEEWAFNHPAIDIVSTSYGAPGSVPCGETIWQTDAGPCSNLQHSFDGVVTNGKLHFGADDNSPSPALQDGTGGPWWSIGIAGFDHDTRDGSGGTDYDSNGKQLVSGSVPDFVADFSQVLPYCHDCQSGLDNGVAGTSFATPRSAGTASLILMEARAAANHNGGISNGNLIEGDLAQSINNWQFRRALEEAAYYTGIEDYNLVDGPFDPSAPVPDAGPYALVGWGVLDPVIKDAALGQLNGDVALKSADACAYMTAYHEAAYAYWSVANAASEGWMAEDAYILCDQAPTGGAAFGLVQGWEKLGARDGDSEADPIIEDAQGDSTLPVMSDVGALWISDDNGVGFNVNLRVHDEVPPTTWPLTTSFRAEFAHETNDDRKEDIRYRLQAEPDVLLGDENGWYWYFSALNDAGTSCTHRTNEATEPFGGVYADGVITWNLDYDDLEIFDSEFTDDGIACDFTQFDAGAQSGDELTGFVASSIGPQGFPADDSGAPAGAYALGGDVNPPACGDGPGIEVCLDVDGPAGFTDLVDESAVVGDETWSFSPAGTLPDGVYTATATQFEDGVSVATESIGFTVSSDSGEDTEAPSQVVNAQATAAGTNSIDVTWDAATDNVAVTEYRLQRATSSGGPYTDIATPTGTSFTDSGRDADTTYHYVVSALDAAGNEGAGSAEASATTDSEPVGEVVKVYVDDVLHETISIDSSSTNPASWSSNLDTTTLGKEDQQITIRADYDDGNGGTASHAVTVTVDNDVLQENVAPTASAGNDQSVDEGTMVTLNGSDSSDSDGTIETYAWTQLSGTTVALDDPAASQPSFTAPQVEAAGETLQFQLQVTDDDGATATATVTINVNDVAAENREPTLQNPGNQAVQAGQDLSVALLASDADDDDLQFSLTTNGDLVLDDAGDGTAWLNWTTLESDVGSYFANASVSDGRGGTAWQNFTVVVAECSEACTEVQQVAPEITSLDVNPGPYVNDEAHDVSVTGTIQDANGEGDIQTVSARWKADGASGWTDIDVTPTDASPDDGQLEVAFSIHLPKNTPADEFIIELQVEDTASNLDTADAAFHVVAPLSIGFTGTQGYWDFGTMTHGGTDHASANRLVISNAQGRDVAVRFDMTDFTRRGGDASITVQGNSYIVLDDGDGILDTDKDTVIQYDDAIVTLEAALADGESIELWLVIETIPELLESGTYTASFGIYEA